MPVFHFLIVYVFLNSKFYYLFKENLTGKFSRQVYHNERKFSHKESLKSCIIHY